MSLLIEASSSKTGIDLPTYLAKEIDIFALDVDDTLYHVLTALHPQIKARIAEDANANDELKPLRQSWADQKRISANGLLTTDDLSWAFPFIVQLYRQKEIGLDAYLERTYDIDYSVVPRQPGFVAAVDTCRKAGKKFVIYSNGPLRHIQKILMQIGFSDKAFREKDIVDLVKTDRHPEMLSRFGIGEEKAADVFRKPTKDGFQRSAEVLGFAPNKRVAYIEDNLANLEAVSSLGILRLHIATKEEDLHKAPKEGKSDFSLWSHECDAAGRAFSTTGLLMQAVANRLLVPRTCGLDDLNLLILNPLPW